VKQFQQCFRNVISKTLLNSEVSDFINIRYCYEMRDGWGNIILKFIMLYIKLKKIARFCMCIENNVGLTYRNAIKCVRTTETHSF
jgi:hypothetical protein